MATISDLCDDLLVKILSLLPTKVAVSTSILSKRWEFLWMRCPNLNFDCIDKSVSDFINKNLPLHKAPIIHSLCLGFLGTAPDSENLKTWIEIAISRGVRELMCFSNSYDVFSSDGNVILTPTLKYFNDVDFRSDISSYLIEHMPELEEADILVPNDIYMQKLLKSITTVKRLSLHVIFNIADEIVFGDGIVFNQLKVLKLHIYDSNWSKLLFMLLKHSPKLQILDLHIHDDKETKEYKPANWINNPSSVPRGLLKSLKEFISETRYTDEEVMHVQDFIIDHQSGPGRVRFSFLTGA